MRGRCRRSFSFSLSRSESVIKFVCVTRSSRTVVQLEVEVHRCSSCHCLWLPVSPSSSGCPKVRWYATALALMWLGQHQCDFSWRSWNVTLNIRPRWLGVLRRTLVTSCKDYHRMPVYTLLSPNNTSIRNAGIWTQVLQVSFNLNFQCHPVCCYSKKNWSISNFALTKRKRE